jgi:hypothetical protein
MPKSFIKKNVLVNGNYVSKWVELKKIYLKRNGSWTSLATAYVKKNVLVGSSYVSKWVKVFEGTGPTLNSSPTLTASNGGKLYDTFTTTNGSWDGATSFTRIWLRSDTETGTYTTISGQTSTTYTTTDADNGKWIRAEVTASDGVKENQASTTPYNITKYKPVSLTAPTLSGSTRVDAGLYVTGDTATYWKSKTINTSDTSPASYSYAWQKTNGTAAANSTDSSTYSPTSTDVGQTIRAVVTATNTGGSTAAYSAFSAEIEAKLVPNKMATPTSSGITTTNITWTVVKPAAVAGSYDSPVTWEYYTSTSSTAPSASTAATGEVGFDISLSKNITYTSSTSPSIQYFWVRGVNNYSEKGEWSDAASATPTAEVTRITAPTSPSVSVGTHTMTASTSLVRISNVSKDQYWSIVRKGPVSLSWVKVTEATSYEYYYSGTNSAPNDTIDLALTNSVSGQATQSASISFDAASSDQTWYFWIRSKATASNYSTWVYMGSVTITAISVTAFAIRLYRGSSTSTFSNPDNPPAWDDFNYPWRSLFDRGNPATGGEGHYAQIRFTANGIAYIRSTSTV